MNFGQPLARETRAPTKGGLQVARVRELREKHATGMRPLLIYRPIRCGALQEMRCG